MGPIQLLYARALQDYLGQFPETPPQRPHMGLLEDESAFAPRRGVGPRSFRDPMQAGPEPPMKEGPIASLFRGRP